jgi:hypothetical protein
MALNILNTDAISFKKLSGKVHTQQNFAVTEEGISTNVQSSYSTVFANQIVKLPATQSGLTALYSTNGIVEKVKFQVDIIPDTQIAAGRSQGYRLKLPSDYNTFGYLFPSYSAETYLHTALGKLQIVPSLYGTLKVDGTTEYDPVLYQTNGSTIIGKFDSINWYLDTYSGILFVQDPPIGFDVSAARPGFIEAYLYVGDYLDNFISASPTLITANNGLTKVGDNIRLGGELTGNTLINAAGKQLGVFNASSVFLSSSGSTSLSGIGTYISGKLVEISSDFVGGEGISIINNGNQPLAIINNHTGSSLNINSNTDINVQLANTKTFKYNNDYSSAFGPRSIPDVGFVTGLTSNLSGVFENGLTKQNNKVKLGGNITGNTVLRLTNNADLTISGDSNNTITFQGFDGALWFKDTTGGGVFFEDSAGGGVYFRDTDEGTINFQSSGGISLQGREVGVAAPIRTNLTIDRDNVRFTDSRVIKKGIEYAGNYSSGFTKHSLVDINYVTGITAISSIVANNGITKIGNNLTLGGTLTGNTNFAFNGLDSYLNLNPSQNKFDLYVQEPNFDFSNVLVETNKIELLSYSESGFTGIILYGSNNDNDPSLNGVIRLQTSRGILVERENNDPLFKGLYYDGNYSSLFGPRSIPDVAFVTGLTSQMFSGSTTQIPFVNSSNTFSYNSNFTYDRSTNIFKAGDGFSVTSAGSAESITLLGIGHTISGSTNGVIRWGTLLGELNSLITTGNGGLANSSILGGNSNIIKTTGSNTIFNAMILGGAFNTITASGNSINSALIFGRFNEAHGTYAMSMGWRSKATGAHSIAFGASKNVEDTTIQKVLASGIRAINISTNSSGQTSGHGARGNYSMILGGWDSDVPTTAINSVIIGGQGIKVQTGVTNTVHLPKLRIGLGANASMVTNNTNNNVVVRNSVTGELEIRNDSTLPGNKYSETFTGNGVTMNFQIIHNKNTRDVIVQVYDAITYDTVFVDTIRTTVNAVNINFISPPPNGQNYRVVVI